MIKKGTQVKWQWGNGTGEGRVVEVHHEKVTRKLKGSEITRDASQDEPAYLIEQDDGRQVLKSASEVQRA